MTIPAALRHGIRRLRKHPAHSALAVLTLGLGIGLTTAMYAVVDGTFLRGLPFADADRIVRVERVQRDGQPGAAFTAEDFRALAAGQTSCDAFAAWLGTRLRLSAPGQPAEPANGAYATADLFRIAGVRPAVGRTLGPGDESPGAPPVVLLSGDLWRRRFGSDPGVVGRTLELSGEPATVIGVMPPGFRFPLNQYFWLPLRLDEAARRSYPLQIAARLRDGVPRRQAVAEIRTLGSRLPAPAAGTAGSSVRAVPFVEAYVDQELRSRQWLMLGAIFGVLLIACVNVSHLLLARAVEEMPEIAVRAALGGRVFSQALAEALALAAAGGLLGLGIAWASLRLYRRSLGDDIPSFWVDVRLDGRVFLFAAAVALLAGVVAGLVPAFQAARSDPGDLLRDGGRGATGARAGRLSRGLAMAEIALSCALLIPTGLAVKGLVKLARLDAGFPADRVLTAQIALEGPRPAGEAAQRRYFLALGPRLAALPGVRAVAFASVLPLERLVAPTVPVLPEGLSWSPDAGPPRARWASVSAGYFEVFGLRLLAGRTFSEQDGPGAPPVLLVSRGFAERFFPGGSALGRRVRAGGADRPWRTVVGVVADLSLGGLDGGDGEPMIYYPWQQAPVWGESVALRTAGEPTDLAPALRREVAAVDPAASVDAVRTAEEAIQDAGRSYVRAGLLFGLFGGTALLLAVLGLYGAMAFVVARRTREIGVRMALGARPGDIRNLVLRAGLLQLGVGTALGLAAALAFSRLLASLVYQVRPWDPEVFVLAPAVLAAAGLLASLLPARRAARVDPMESLRAE